MEGGRRREDGVMVMRKGPWMAEEDEILMEYVRKYGPRDWSSIRSKGLLPRTGKSCRLRWVNKLKPDLKTGCKFSPEEERVVIDLQAQFGNKWARIATYLPGRTDNDVKNFWSTRQKRLARLLRTTLPTKSQKNHGKMSVPHEVPSLPNSSFDLIPFGHQPSNGQCSQRSSTDFSDPTQMMQVPVLFSQSLLDLDTTLPLLESETDERPCSSSNIPPQDLPFNQLPLPPLDLPLLLEGQDFIPGLGDMSFEGNFATHEASQCLHPPDGLPYFQQDTPQHGIKREDTNPGMLDGFFDELPADMFDNLDPPPASSAW